MWVCVLRSPELFIFCFLTCLEPPPDVFEGLQWFMAPNWMGISSVIVWVSPSQFPDKHQSLTSTLAVWLAVWGSDLTHLCAVCTPTRLPAPPYSFLHCFTFSGNVVILLREGFQMDNNDALFCLQWYNTFYWINTNSLFPKIMAILSPVWELSWAWAKCLLLHW